MLSHLPPVQVIKLPTTPFLLFRVLSTYLDQWLAFSTKFPRECTRCQTRKAQKKNNFKATCSIPRDQYPVFHWLISCYNNEQTSIKLRWLCFGCAQMADLFLSWPKRAQIIASQRNCTQVAQFCFRFKFSFLQQATLDWALFPLIQAWQWPEPIAILCCA